MSKVSILFAGCFVLASVFVMDAAASPALRGSFAPAAIQRGAEHDIYEMGSGFMPKTHLGLRNVNEEEDKKESAYKPGITGTWDLVLNNEEDKKETAYKPGITSTWDLVLSKPADKKDTFLAPETEPCTPIRPWNQFC
eukprot:CAMPEP_0196737918 /NCGR_PEP_ID=MMETSP1091-20130531/15493_1 /TAXON_ID=302021 /ORGANISM="Rhodomonas sp., Strain CCMP768" /LENGTH=137 /DNA_ID=CAMNT_0042081837 /DNA_START=27 /DNA_END=440 /DNA_ORIENTATION=+